MTIWKRIATTFVVAGGALALLGTFPAAAGLTNQQVDQTNFLVNASCSGTLIDTQRKLILTAYHCIDTQYRYVERETIGSDGEVKKTKVRIVVPGTVSQIFYKGPSEFQRNNYVYNIIASDNRKDLALLQVEAKLPQDRASPVACKGVERMDTVYAVGNSFGILYSSITKGIVSSLTRSYRDLNIAGDLGDASDSGEQGLVQHSAPTVGGNSGGALYNDDGELAGVHVRGAGTRTGFGFAVPLEDIKSFLVAQNLERLWSRCKKED